MKIETNEHGNIVFKEVFNGVLLETEGGNKISVCMRGDTFEVNIIPKDRASRWHKVNMQKADFDVL